MTATERKKSPVNKDMLEVEGASAITGLPPGTIDFRDISIAELGRLSSFPDPTQIDNPTEGSGEYIVVLSDFITGTGDLESFPKGSVRRISRVVTGFDTVDETDPDRLAVKGRIRRLFGLGAIRKATPEEVNLAHTNEEGQIEITVENETATVRLERERRVQAEQENQILRERLALAEGSRLASSPSTAGVDVAAQTAIVEEGKEKVEGDWE